MLRKYGIAAPGPFSETPKPGDALFARVENRVIATARRSLERTNVNDYRAILLA